MLNAIVATQKPQHNARAEYQSQSLYLLNISDPLQGLSECPKGSDQNAERTTGVSCSEHPGRATGPRTAAKADTLGFGDGSVNDVKKTQTHSSM